MGLVRRIAVVITARPSFARIRTVLDALAVDPRADLQIIMAASSLLHHYGTVERDCPYPIAERVYSTLDGNTPTTSATETGLLTVQLAQVFSRLKPDIVVTIADRHETLATAIAASYQNCQLAHLQGGERTGNIDDRVRNAVSALADLHFPATECAADRLAMMDVRGDIIVYGCPSIDLALRAQPNPAYDGALIVLQHAVTDEVEKAREQVDATLDAVLGWDQRRVVWFWPGQDAGSDAVAKRLREVEHAGTSITFRRHLPAHEFLSVLRSASVLVGNSSAGIREAGVLGTPVVDIGTRQSGRQCGAHVTHVNHIASEITHAIRHQLDHGRYPRSDIYGRGDAGARIAAALVDPQTAGLTETLGSGASP
jgi:UDP-hydrolysing UDP-N-acetyl-D-glucosamine 2-epimerase